MFLPYFSKYILTEDRNREVKNMDLTGITGKTIQVREIRPEVTVAQINAAASNNNLDEIVVENDKGKFIIFGDNLDIKGKIGLPAVGTQVNFGEVHGKVIFKNNEVPYADAVRSDTSVKALCVKNKEELAMDALLAKRIAEQAARTKEAAETARINAPIIEAEKKSDENQNTASIYGPQVTKEDAESWLKNNPDLAKSQKLIKLADFKTIDGKVDADELSKISSGGAVVLNGPNSFYLPGMKKDEEAPVVKHTPAPTTTTIQVQGGGRQPMSQQEQYYKRKNQEAAVDAAVGVTGALIDGLSGILR
jgi:hypothetical protein